MWDEMNPHEKAAALRAAAEHFDNGRMLSTGGAIWWALSADGVDKSDNIEARFSALFVPDDNMSRQFWNDEWVDNARECSVLALLLAAAMAEAGDL